MDLGIPRGTMIVLVEHDGAFAVPTGATRLRAGDRLLVLGPDDATGEREALGTADRTPGGRTPG